MYAGDLTIGLSLRGGVLTPGCWGHVAFTFDAAGTARLYVDGTEVASGSFQGTLFAFASVKVEFSGLSNALFYPWRACCLRSSPVSVKTRLVHLLSRQELGYCWKIAKW